MGARGLNRPLMLDIGLSGLCTLWSPVMDACMHSSVHDYFLILGGGWRGLTRPLGGRGGGWWRWGRSVVCSNTLPCGRAVSQILPLGKQVEVHLVLFRLLVLEGFIRSKTNAKPAIIQHTPISDLSQSHESTKYFVNPSSHLG